LLFDVEFVPAEAQYGATGILSQEIKALYKGGFMNTVSIGGRALESEHPDEEGGPDRVYTKTELLELSLVPVPANPNALMVGRGLESAHEAGVLSEDGVRAIHGVLDVIVKKINEEKAKTTERTFAQKTYDSLLELRPDSAKESSKEEDLHRKIIESYESLTE
jgi:hypothetical protein